MKAMQLQHAAAFLPPRLPVAPGRHAPLLAVGLLTILAESVRRRSRRR